MRRPSSQPASAAEVSDKEIARIDALFEVGGLVRSLRGNSSGITHRRRMARASREELMGPAPEPRRAANGAEWFPVQAWEQPARGKAPDWLMAGFSSRRGGQSRAYCAGNAPGELNLQFTRDDRAEDVRANRRLLAEAVGGSAATPLVTLSQIHSNLIWRVDRTELEREHPRPGDGLMTDEPGLLLGIMTADCIPVLVADRKRHAVAAFHAGWKGTVGRIVEAGIGRMRMEFGSRPEDLTAVIGPGIGPCCYAVGEELRSAFDSQFAYADELFHEVSDDEPVHLKYPMLFLTQRAPGHSPIGPALHLDLVEANRRQLVAAGLKPRAISHIGGCTNCHHTLFFSHRYEQGHAGRLMAVIGIRA